jgi:hypothetical protein
MVHTVNNAMDALDKVLANESNTDYCAITYYIAINDCLFNLFSASLHTVKLSFQSQP